MLLLDQTLSPALNLALDDALLETAESSSNHPEVLRFWHPAKPMVVIGRSSPLQTEVNLDFCRENDIPIFRRISGGQSIVTGPGCLMYAVLLSYELRPQLRSLDQAHQFVMNRLQSALERKGIATAMEGTCDLTIDGRKFSGNALRCRRNWFLYHGTIILDGFDLNLIERCLGTPKRQPEYRGARSHLEFVTSLPLGLDEAKLAIIDQWSPTGILDSFPLDVARKLQNEKYDSAEWLQKIP